MNPADFGFEETQDEKIARLEKENQDLIESIGMIANRQLRERQENAVIFAVENDEGQIVHEGATYEGAREAAKFYANGQVVTQTRTPWKYVSPANETIEGN